MTTDSWKGSGIGNWTTDADWSLGAPPTSSEDAFIGTGSGGLVGSGANETVHSIGVNANYALDINNNSTFTATLGTGSQSILGTVAVEGGGNFVVGSGNTTVSNSGTIELQSASGGTAFFIVAQNAFVTLNGGGNVELDGAGGQANYIGGQPNAELINQNNDISGTGAIYALQFFNQGIIETNNSFGDGTLQIWGNGTGVGSFENEGSMFVDAGGTMILGYEPSGNPTQIGNLGLVQFLGTSSAAAVMEIAGNLTIVTGTSTGGTISLQGPDPDNDRIVSNGSAATLTLEGGTLEGAGEVGDANLTLNLEQGTLVDANNTDGIANPLYFNTGNNAISNSGTLEATGGGDLDVASGITNEGSIVASAGSGVDLTGQIDNLGGTILANGNGIVNIYNQIFNMNGGLISIASGGELVLSNSAQLHGDINFTGPQATLYLELGGSQISGNVVGAGVGDFFDFHGISYSSDLQTIWQQNGGSGTLQLWKSGSEVAYLDLAGQYASTDFSVQNDGSGGALVEVTGWGQIDGGSPTAMTSGDFQGNGSAQLAVSESNGGTYIWANGVGFTKIDGDTYSLMAAGDFYGTTRDNNSNVDLAVYAPGFGTYTWQNDYGWTKIDSGAASAMAAGTFNGGSMAELAASFSGGGVYLWSSAGGWTKIDGGAPTILAAADFYGKNNGNGNDTDLAAYYPGAGTYIWNPNAGWSKIDSGAASYYATGNFLGASNGNNNQNDLAAYFAGAGTYIWESANDTWAKIDIGTSTGLAAISLGNGQTALLSYDQGAGVEEWQSGLGWTAINGTTIPTSETQAALFATGNFTGNEGANLDIAQEPIIGFNGAPSLWLDPPPGTSGSLSGQNASLGYAANADNAGAIGSGTSNTALFGQAVASSFPPPSISSSPLVAAVLTNPSPSVALPHVAA